MMFKTCSKWPPINKIPMFHIYMAILFVYVTISLLVFLDTAYSYAVYGIINVVVSAGDQPSKVHNVTNVSEPLVHSLLPTQSIKDLHKYSSNSTPYYTINTSLSSRPLPIFRRRLGVHTANLQHKTEHMPLTPVKKTKLKKDNVRLTKTFFTVNDSVAEAGDIEVLALMKKFFKRRVEDKYKDICKQTLDIFDKTVKRLNGLYFMYGGTLLGSYRHHDMTPWDDDTDVLVPLAFRLPLYAALSKLAPDFLVSSDQVHYLKLFSSKSLPIKKYKWKWPFLDIFFYDENATHIWDVTPKYRDSFVYPKSVVFPVRRRPFMGLSLLSPHDPLAVLSQNYDVNVCFTGNWIHRWERFIQEASVPCSYLHSLHPFVKRTSMNGGCNETLELKGHIISFFFEHGSPCQLPQKITNRN